MVAPLLFTLFGFSTLIFVEFPSNLFFARRVLDLTYLPLLSLVDLYNPRIMNIVAIVLLL